VGIEVLAKTITRCGHLLRSFHLEGWRRACPCALPNSRSAMAGKGRTPNNRKRQEEGTTTARCGRSRTLATGILRCAQHDRPQDLCQAKKSTCARTTTCPWRHMPPGVATNCGDPVNSLYLSQTFLSVTTWWPNFLIISRRFLKKFAPQRGENGQTFL